jgi:DNA-binding CsgD family transcriptional regulator
MGVNVAGLLARHGSAELALADRDTRLPWSLFIELLALLEQALGGPRALEQFGAEVGRAHPLFRLLALLHFGLPEIQFIAASRLLPVQFEGVLRSVVRRQPDGAFRITVSLNRELEPSYPFWTWLLGQWRTLPRLFEHSDSIIEVEMADRFAEFLVISPVLPPTDPAFGREIRRPVRDHLLKELVTYEELLELPKPNLRSSLLEHRLEASELTERHPADFNVAAAMKLLVADIAAKLQTERLQLYEMSPVGLRRVCASGEPLARARIRRMLWVSGNAVGAIEVERPGEAGHARVASLLDEHIDSFAYRFAQIQNRLPASVTVGGFTQAEPEIRDPTIAEPPPSSRGRIARAARDGRLSELAAKWQLTERQRAVLALLVEGLANKEIAARLDCSVGTIENHVTRLLKRAAVDCRAALTALFWRTSERY